MSHDIVGGFPVVASVLTTTTGQNRVILIDCGPMAVRDGRHLFKIGQHTLGSRGWIAKLTLEATYHDALHRFCKIVLDGDHT